MEDCDNESPETGANANLEQTQAGQQPPTAQQPQQPETTQASEAEQSGQAQQPPETSQQGQSGEQPGHIGQSEAMTEQKSDIEGSSGGSPATGQAPPQPSGFVGSEGSSDSSSELVEGDDYAKDGQGAPDGE
ncbi:MAG: hypothetical protein ABIR51_08555 [Sphingomicrobium sp.]